MYLDLIFLVVYSFVGYTIFKSHYHNRILTLLSVSIVYLAHYFIGYKYTFPILILIDIMSNWLSCFTCTYCAPITPPPTTPITENNLSDLISMADDSTPVRYKDIKDKEMEFINFMINSIRAYKDRGILTEGILHELYDNSKAEIRKNPSLVLYIKNEVLKCRMNSSVGSTHNNKLANKVPLSKSTVEWLD